MREFSAEYYELIKQGVPSVYYLNAYGGVKKMKDVRFIVEDIDWMPWSGGEFIGGTASFFNKIYDEILSIKDAYWSVINQELFHVGDEMLTSIALARLWQKQNLCPVDAKWFGVIHRYWSAFETKSIWNYGTFFIHLPGDKMFEAHIELSATTVSELLAGYGCFCKKQRLKHFIKGVIASIKKKF